MEHDNDFKRSAIDQWPKEAHCTEEEVPEASLCNRDKNRLLTVKGTPCMLCGHLLRSSYLN